MRLTKVFGLAALLGVPGAAGAQTLADSLLGTCYARAYDAAHLGTHPEQRVAEIRVFPYPVELTPEGPVVVVEVRLIDSPLYLATIAYCDRGKTLTCGQEGDMGEFTLTPRDGGRILLEVADRGMTFELGPRLVYLSAHSGDDRSFLLASTGPCSG